MSDLLRMASSGHRPFGFAIGAAAVLPLLMVLGCSEPSDRGRVTGRITVDGAAPPEGYISFSPVDGASPTVGSKISNGEYAVDVPFGVSKVAIRVPKVVGQKKMYDTPESPIREVKQESLPAKYNDNSELEIEVTPGTNEHNFELATN